VGKRLKILGISAFYHDAAAALLVDGEIVAAAQEERFSRIKHDPRFPIEAIRYCLSEAKLKLDDIDHVIFFEKPFLKFERLLETYAAFAPRGIRSFLKAMPIWIKEKLFQKRQLERALAKVDGSPPRLPILFGEHHLSHAASAFYPSPFEEALVLTMDGVGEWATTTLALGRVNDLNIIAEMKFPHSLGLLYSAFTYYCGFKVNSGEYKLMGLAPYGEPRDVEVIERELIDIKTDGSFRLNLRYFDYAVGLKMTHRRFDALFGGAPRQPDEPLTQRHMDLAASIQKVTERIVLKLATAAHARYGIDRLCLAGGVALNCVANGELQRSGVFKEIWIQPAAGDAGGSLGAALYAQHARFGLPRRIAGRDSMRGSYLGPSVGDDEAAARLHAAGARFTRLPIDALVSTTADALANGAGVGWVQGRMEFGPRALGARSILGDPRSPTMQAQLNLKVKFRESFRPFAPAVAAARVSDYFELAGDSPYMLLVAPVRADLRREMNAEESARFGIDKLNAVRSSIPAVTHVDYSARVQTVHADTNPRFAALIDAFEQKTGCAVLINTSFNVRGEPIVNTPEDAFRCFMGCDLDVLVVGDCYLDKAAQDPALKRHYADTLAAD
jgi:carbamoyltransferase